MMLNRIVLSELTIDQRRLITRRSAVPVDAVREQAAAIVAEVREGGDAALARAGALYGGSRPEVRVQRSEIEAALGLIDDSTRVALETAIEHIAKVHRAQTPADVVVSTAPGVEVTRAWTALRRVAAYVPGGKAAYPSTLLMTVVPARLAGVNEVVVASPADESGAIAPVLLAAAHLAGVDELYAMGGAQAIAALAYGTETIEPVDKIVGPGNSWVTAAKLAVLGECGIDLPAGPSEALVIADGSCPARWVAADLLCQAEHGPDSPAVLVTTDPSVADRVEQAVAELLPTLERASVLADSLEHHGLVVIAADHTDAIAFANEYAAEHVSLATADPEQDAKRVTAAGSVYVGAFAAESAGDYATGANHVLPTGGLPVAYGPLGLEDFGSWRQIQRIDRTGLSALRPTIEALAVAEGLTAHRLSAAIRFEGGGAEA